jgi:hypothetical protein
LLIADCRLPIADCGLPIAVADFDLSLPVRYRINRQSTIDNRQ